MLRLRARAAEPGERGQLMREFGDPSLELARLLREASEIEHALLVQYLYAAFSVKPRYSRIVGVGFSNSSDLLGVAIQEMTHLHEVSRMLVALGAPPNLERQDFPYEPDIYPFAFHLEPLGLASLAKYVFTEASAQALVREDPANAGEAAFLDRLFGVLGDARPNHLGSLYASIIEVTEEVLASPPAGVDLSGWPQRLEAIKSEGEDDHFAFFKDLFLGTHAGFEGQVGVWELEPADPAYPSFALPVNPTAFERRPGMIADDTTRAIAWLSDLHYWIILALLDFSYRHASPNAMFLAKAHMTGPLQRLGEHIAQLGGGTPFDPLSMGYNLGLDRVASVRLLGNLLGEAEKVTQEVRAHLPQDFPFTQIERTLSRLPQL